MRNISVGAGERGDGDKWFLFTGWPEWECTHVAFTHHKAIKMPQYAKWQAQHYVCITWTLETLSDTPMMIFNCAELLVPFMRRCGRPACTLYPFHIPAYPFRVTGVPEPVLTKDEITTMYLSLLMQGDLLTHDYLVLRCVSCAAIFLNNNDKKFFLCNL